MEKRIKNKAFTLVELMIVFSMMVLLSITIYAPYNYYSNKAKLKVAKTEIAKTIYEARNMAIYGLDDGVGNKSIGVYFDNSLSKNSLKIYSYPYDFSGQKNNFSLSDIKLIKEIKLQDGVQINKIDSQNNALFYFQAISGIGSYFYFPGVNTFTNDEINIKFSFKNGGANLSSKVVYLTKTNIVDY